MDEKARSLATEDRLEKLGIHWHVEDAVPFDLIAVNDNPARWKERYNELHRDEIGCAIIDQRPVPAFLLYKPPGATRYHMLGGRHRKEACHELHIERWPAYVIDQPLDEFLIEALPVFDNVGLGKEYTKAERLEMAAHLVTFSDREPKAIATALQLKPAEITQFVDLQAAMNRAHDAGVGDSDMRKLAPNLQIEANKALPIDAVFKAVVETLAFTEMQGHAAKGLIKDAQTARSEATALRKLADIFEKHKAELERRKRGGKKYTPTLAQKVRRPIRVIENLWPGRVELLEVTAHDDDFIADFETGARNVRNMLNEVIDRCAQVRAMREKYRAERKELNQTGGSDSATRSPPT